MILEAAKSCYLKTLREPVLLELPAHDKAAADRLDQISIKLTVAPSAKPSPKGLEAAAQVDLRAPTLAEAETKP